MSSKTTDNYYGFVIDTDTYAGNFEREMCAYMTGMIGDCGVGDEYVDFEIQDMFHDNVKSVADDSGCYRPVTIYLDRDGKGYNSVLIYFRRMPTSQQITMLKDRAFQFAVTDAEGEKLKNRKYSIKSFRWIKFEFTTTELELEIDII